MKIKRLLALALAFAMLGAMLVSCGERPAGDGGEEQPTDEVLIERRIEQFVTYYNDGDMEQVLTCLESKTANAFQALLNLLGGLAGNYSGIDVDLKDLFSLGVSTVSGDFMGLTIHEISVKDSVAVAKTTMRMPGGATTIYFSLLYERDGWYISNMTDKALSLPGPTTGDGVTEDSSAVGIEVVDLYSDNECLFVKNDITYYGVFNDRGVIFYYQEDEIDWTVIGNGGGYVKTKDGTYLIFNAEGNQTATSADGAFDEIIGYGDGFVLVYQNQGTISVEAHAYGVLDLEGDWITPLTVRSKIPQGTYSTSPDYSYKGDNVWEYGKYLFNSKENKCFHLHNVIVSDKFIDGAIYCTHPEGLGSIWRRCIEDVDSGEWYDLPEYCLLYSDGSFEELPACYDYENDLMLLNVESDQYLKIYDRSTDSTYEYRNFPLSVIGGKMIEYRHVWISIKGADGNTYYTVLNSKGEQLFEPIPYKIEFLTSDTLIYSKNDYREVIDLNGNVLISSDQKYTYIETFGLDSLRGKVADGFCRIIDLKGNVLSPIDQKYTAIGDLYNGLAIAGTEEGGCYIGADGKPIVIRCNNN